MSLSLTASAAVDAQVEAIIARELELLPADDSSVDDDSCDEPADLQPVFIGGVDGSGGGPDRKASGLRLDRLAELARQCHLRQDALLHDLGCDDTAEISGASSAVVVDTDNEQDLAVGEVDEQLEREHQKSLSELESERRRIQQRMQTLQQLQREVTPPLMATSDIDAASTKNSAEMSSMRQSVHHQQTVVHRQLRFRLDKAALHRQWLASQLRTRREELLLLQDKQRQAASMTNEDASLSAAVRGERQRQQKLTAEGASLLRQLDATMPTLRAQALLWESRRDSQRARLDRCQSQLRRLSTATASLLADMAAVKTDDMSSLEAVAAKVRSKRDTLLLVARMSAAALLLQHWWRARLTRLGYLRARQACVKAQRWWRGAIVPLIRARHMRQQWAATKLQALYRGHRARLAWKKYTEARQLLMATTDAHERDVATMPMAELDELPTFDTSLDLVLIDSEQVDEPEQLQPIVNLIEPLPLLLPTATVPTKVIPVMDKPSSASCADTARIMCDWGFTNETTVLMLMRQAKRKQSLGTAMRTRAGAKFR